MMLRSRWSRLAFISVFPGLIVMAALSVYAMYNDSGHTAISPWTFSPVFILQIAAGLPGLKYRDPLWPAAAALLTGIAGLLFLLWLDRSNTLLQYHVWIERGMP